MSPEERRDFQAKMRAAGREREKQRLLEKGRMFASFGAGGLVTVLIWGNDNSRGWDLLWAMLTLLTVSLPLSYLWERAVRLRRQARQRRQ